MNRKILIVDDSDFDRALLTKALTQKEKFDVIEAKNGDECIDILSTHAIDLILMDIMMPGAFGTQVLIKIREKFNPIELPIIMVTAKADPRDIISCLQSGANDYITKPVHFESAMSRIATHLKLADVSKEMSRLKEIDALNALITTYNHEINNPLTIAIGCLNKENWNKKANIEQLKNALWRIAEIVKKIKNVTEKKEVEYLSYVGSTKMLKVK